jgi:D-alanyl-lipoteichoic acid acyltransferase DltB (MBOAT superfamily)
MLFNSLQFVLFFIVVTILYYTLDHRWRWKMLLAASCIFYMAFIPAYIFILFTTILIDYFMAIMIARSTGRRRLIYLQISIVSTCLVLFIFKYCALFGMTVRELQALIGSAQDFPITHIILPIGLSFHTFQSLSYVIEVYRGKQEPERNFGIYSLYVMFYPQLVAGPIERPQNLLHQFYEEHRFELQNLSRGLALIAWGMFQKMVIADRGAVYVNAVYSGWQWQSGLSLLMATLLFAVQIYADFAGYSSIAIGCARVMGFHLSANFNHPYFSTSFAEFWKRWHISLSTWFRDYVYIPLGGNRVSASRCYLNLLLTFMISGLWHGANWTFVIWGAYHGLLLIAEKIFTGMGWHYPGNMIGRILRRSVVLLGICIGWVLFRAESLHAALSILRRIFTGTSLSISSIGDAISQWAGDTSSIALALAAILFIAVLFGIEARQESIAESRRAVYYSSLKYQFAATVALFEAIMLFGSLRSAAFIYFQF